jgi:hypothetical protein
VGDGRPGGSFTTLVEHWDGGVWRVVADAGFAGTGFNHLSAIAAVSANDVWAAGRIGRHPNPIIEHWNGTTWSIVASPNSGALNAQSFLTGALPLGPLDVWAVGRRPRSVRPRP